MLLLHHLVFTSSQLLELQLMNVHLQDQHDWTFLVDSLDFLETSLKLDSRSIMQLLSVKPATDLFLSQMETVSVGSEKREQLVLHESTIEIPALTEQASKSIKRFLHMCTVETLNIQCPLFDADKAQTFAQALGGLPWSAFQSVVLEGQNVNGWLKLLAKMDGLLLKNLKLVGTTKLEQQRQQQQRQQQQRQHVLSEPSVLFIQKLIRAGTVVDHESVRMSSADGLWRQRNKSDELFFGQAKFLLSLSLQLPRRQSLSTVAFRGQSNCGVDRDPTPPHQTSLTHQTAPRSSSAAAIDAPSDRVHARQCYGPWI